MRLITPILAAIIAAALVALVLRLIGGFIPGESFEPLGNLIILLVIGFTIVPPIAFGVVGARIGLQRMPMAAGIMLVLQIVLLVVLLMGLANLSTGFANWMLLGALIVVVPALSSGAALALTGNLGNRAS